MMRMFGKKRLAPLGFETYPQSVRRRPPRRAPPHTQDLVAA
jgi:hypothetical protein